MPTAPATLTRVGPSRIQVVSAISGLNYFFTININPALPPFTSSEATIEYRDEGALTNNHSVMGNLGTDTFQLTLDNGSIIRGKLSGISHNIAVSGNGLWEEN